MVKTLSGLAGFILAVCVSADDQKMLTEIVVESGFKKSIKSGIAQEMEAPSHSLVSHSMTHWKVPFLSLL